MAQFDKKTGERLDPPKKAPAPVKQDSKPEPAKGSNKPEKGGK